MSGLHPIGVFPIGTAGGDATSSSRSLSAITRLGLYGGPRPKYADNAFDGKAMIAEARTVIKSTLYVASAKQVPAYVAHTRKYDTTA